MISQYLAFTRADAGIRRAQRRSLASSLVACVLLALCGSIAKAADADADADTHRHPFSDNVTQVYDGTWTATFDRGLGTTGTARLVLKDYVGTWQDVGPAGRLKNSVCGGKPMQVTVQMSQKEGFAFTAFGNSVAPQCPDLAVYVKPVDAKTMEGTVEGTVAGKVVATDLKIRLVRTAAAARKR